MKKLISSFIKYPILPNALIAILFIAGVFTLSKTKMSFFPERPSFFVTITMVYPGASPEEIEEGITFKIEEAVKGIPNLKEMTSTSSENFVRVSVEADVGTDMEEFTNEIKNAVDQINSFPVGAEKPIVFKNRGASRALIVMLSGELDLKSLKSEAQRIEDDFLAMEDISQVNISGYPALEISIEVPEETLLRYGLTFDQIASAVRDNNTDISGGELKSSSEEILIRSRNKKFSAEEIGEIVVRSNTDGSRILLRDIAEVKEQFADVPSTFLGNGKPAVTFQIQKLLHEDLRKIDTQVQEYVENYNASNSDTQLDVTFNFYNTLRSRMDLLLQNMGIGLLLIVFTLGIFLNLRLSFWVAFGIVLSFLGLSIIGYLFYDLTINMISLMGMIIVVGILVDDGIVISENIYSHFEKGKSFKRAAIDGTFEVMPAVMTSVTTTMIAFLPILIFVKGSFEFLKDMAFVVIAALGFSLIEAFLILPAHLSSKHVLVKKENANIIRRKLDQAIDFFRFRVYGKIVRWNMKNRYIVLAIPVVLIMMTAGLFQGGLIKFTFFPSIPFDSFNAELAFVPGTPQQKTEDYLIDFEQKIWEVNDSLAKEFNTEGGFIKYTLLAVGNSFQGSEQGSHAGNINVLLKDMEEATISTHEIANRIRKKIGAVPDAEKFAVAGFNRFGTPVSISLLSSNLEAIRSAKEELKTALKAFPELKDIKDNSAAGKREIQLKLTPRAYALGMTHNDILRQIRQGFFGQEIQRIQKGKDEVRIWVRYPKSDRVYMDQLEKVKIKTIRGEQYPLAVLADYDIKRSVVAINHLNAKREVRVEGDLVDQLESLPPILSRIQSDVMPGILQKYPDVSVSYEGQARHSRESSAELQQGLIIAVFIIIFLILLHYKSWYQMVLIISIIPLGWMGAMWGHGLETFFSDLTGRMIKPVSMLSLWGMIALMGILINDGVVFLDKFNLRLKEGLPIEKALYEAATSRFRPIVLTTITTVAGLYPLILERSFQAQFLIPMAISVAYGVMVGTFFILTLLPALIMVFNDLRWYAKWIWSGEKPASREAVERVIIDAKKEEAFQNELLKDDNL